MCIMCITILKMNATINFKTNKEIKKEAQLLAKKMGISLSAVLNMYLNQFVRDQSINISINKLEKTKD